MRGAPCWPLVAPPTGRKSQTMFWGHNEVMRGGEGGGGRGGRGGGRGALTRIGRDWRGGGRTHAVRAFHIETTCRDLF